MFPIKSVLVSAGLSGLVFAFFPTASLWVFVCIGLLVGIICPPLFGETNG
jgi:hypothetical protein